MGKVHYLAWSRHTLVGSIGSEFLVGPTLPLSSSWRRKGAPPSIEIDLKFLATYPHSEGACSRFFDILLVLGILTREPQKSVLPENTFPNMIYKVKPRLSLFRALKHSHPGFVLSSVTLEYLEKK